MKARVSIKKGEMLVHASGDIDISLLAFALARADIQDIIVHRDASGLKISSIMPDLASAHRFVHQLERGGGD